jgi:hypothetical protein
LADGADGIVELMAADWLIAIGEQIRPVELHARYGGRRQGGIGPSKQSPNVLLFSDPSGVRHGYRDGWVSDGTYRYTGEGQRGDQVSKHGNRAVRDYAEEGRTLRLFQGDSGVVTYLGPFKLASD